MTAAILEHATGNASGKPCPPWCTNSAHPRAATQDMCDSGGGDRAHLGRIGAVVLPSRVDEYYDQEIGVELYRYDCADGTVGQLSVLLTYGVECTEWGHATLELVDARRLVDATRSTFSGEGRRSQTRYGEGEGDDIVVEQPVTGRPSRVDMNIDGQRIRMTLDRFQLQSLGDMIACACVLAEVTP